jgi:predicted aldo/keto reductase-like oxidoreductase
MEPLKGGMLAKIPASARAALQAIHPGWSPADWALRFVQSLPNVEVCLSGMTALSEVDANCQPFAPLDAAEVEMLLTVRDIVAGKTAVPCTGCGYCLPHCPQEIPIPTYFGMLNEISRHPEEGWKVRPAYSQTCAALPTPDDCIGCRSCEAHCPQGIPISARLKDVSRKLG